MRITNADHDDILIAINGETRPLSFVLPHDCAWELLWTSQNIQLAHPTEAELTVPLGELKNGDHDDPQDPDDASQSESSHPLEESAQVQAARDQMNSLLAQTHPDDYQQQIANITDGANTADDEDENDDPENAFMVSTSIRSDVKDDEDINIANPGEKVTIPEFTISLWRYQKFED